jgi:hypothetical protein
MRRACAVALLALFASSGATQAATAKLGRARAELAVARKVERVYWRKVDKVDGLAIADCRRKTARLFDCTYDVYGGFAWGYDHPDAGPIAYSGTGSVRQLSNGSIVVKVSAPH